LLGAVDIADGCVGAATRLPGPAPDGARAAIEHLADLGMGATTDYQEVQLPQAMKMWFDGAGAPGSRPLIGRFQTALRILQLC